MSRGPYQVLLLGVSDDRRESLKGLILRHVEEMGLGAETIDFLDEEASKSRDRRSPTMAIFFGCQNAVVDTKLIEDLLDESIVIAPVVTSLTRVHDELPIQIRHLNALSVDGEGDLGRLSNLVLETFRLLRRERRLFISYRRVDAQPMAERLYDALDARGFDVFIDVRSVPPAQDFQSELWHRMSDSDVVVLIDTPGFRESRWTVEELAKANATNIQILHVLWPGQKEDSSSAFSHFLRLCRRDFRGMIPARGRWIRERTIERICNEAERLRARAIAARYRYLVDNFCDAARDMKMEPIVQAQQWILLKGICEGKDLAVVPAVGVPTSNRINEMADAIVQVASGDAEVWIIYDNRGVLNSWLKHLDWLDRHLPVRTVKMASAPARLRELAS